MANDRRPMKIMIPTTRHFGEKAKERRERKGNPNFNIPMMETKVIHPMRMAKERADMTKENPRRSYDTTAFCCKLLVTIKSNRCGNMLGKF